MAGRILFAGLWIIH